MDVEEKQSYQLPRRFTASIHDTENDLITYNVIVELWYIDKPTLLKATDNISCSRYLRGCEFVRVVDVLPYHGSFLDKIGNWYSSIFGLTRDLKSCLNTTAVESHLLWKDEITLESFININQDKRFVNNLLLESKKSVYRDIFAKGCKNECSTFNGCQSFNSSSSIVCYHKERHKYGYLQTDSLPINSAINMIIPLTNITQKIKHTKLLNADDNTDLYDVTHSIPFKMSLHADSKTFISDPAFLIELLKIYHIDICILTYAYWDMVITDKEKTWIKILFISKTQYKFKLTLNIHCDICNLLPEPFSQYICMMVSNYKTNVLKIAKSEDKPKKRKRVTDEENELVLAEFIQSALHIDGKTKKSMLRLKFAFEKWSRNNDKIGFKCYEAIFDKVLQKHLINSNGAKVTRKTVKDEVVYKGIAINPTVIDLFLASGNVSTFQRIHYNENKRKNIV